MTDRNVRPFSSTAVARCLGLALAALLLPAAGCASVLAKTHQRVQFQADRTGTQVVVKEHGTDVEYGPQYTPAWVVLDKSRDYTITFTSPDGAEIDFVPGRTFELLSLLNILGLIWFIPDVYTGAIMRYEEDAWRAEFETDAVRPAIPDTSLPRISLPAYTPQGSRQAHRPANDAPADE